jgi:hypothetical protein
MMTIRIVPHQPASILATIPNELMFLMFSMLPWAVPHAGQQQQQHDQHDLEQQ